MRQHVLRHKEKIIEENRQYLAEDPQEKRGLWHSLFDKRYAKSPLYIEIGSGKGLFITAMVKAHPENVYLACEGAVKVYPRILQKAGAMELLNLKLISEYIIDPAVYFEYGELAGVYLNFSDPWPKDRHANRRLTHVSKLLSYKKIMAPGATLEFKTDNDALFEFSLEQAELAGLQPDRVIRDLHASDLADSNIETEYEQKFAAQGKNINYLRRVF